MDIASITSATPYQSGETRVPVKTLGQDDFLKLIIEQLRNQDPMNPQKDTEFIGQMAQFSALEQAKTMQHDIAGLRTQQQLLQANDLIGRSVQLQAGDGTLIEGIVSSVVVDSGVPKLSVNGHAYDMSQVFSVALAPTSSP